MAKILVVDDSSTVRDEVAGFLRKNGLDVDTAVDGKDGLAKLRANPGVKLVVSDVTCRTWTVLRWSRRSAASLRIRP